MNLLSVATTLTVLVFALFIVLGVRAMRSPEHAARAFGLPLDRARGEFVRVYASRNLAIVATGVALVATGERRALAVLLTAVCALPVFDGLLLLRQRMDSPPYGRHAVALGLLGTCTGLWWLVA
ncbi:MAG: DUF4267 domain-containing protein [Deltaproteobacteria bacterium]|nr:DUF4267 domain-containing protein [Deltaproteobacteria bacterium]